jgi:5-dehydro-4-deoxyglucarate dehydratase
VRPQELGRRLQGVVGFPITPFKRNLSLDLPGLRRNVRTMLKHPFCAVVAAGGTGELYSLTVEEHRAVVAAVVEETRGRIPVIAGAGMSGPLAVQLAIQAKEVGASGILAFPPYYPNADPEGLLAYYAAIGAATSLGLIIYSRDSVDPSPAEVERLASIPTLVALKDGQGDLRRYQRIMARLGKKLRWIGGVGDDLVPGYYSLGIRTYTSSISNVAPGLSIELHEAAAAGDTSALTHLMETYVIPLYALRARRRGYEVTVMKEMMNLMGMAAGPVRPPLPPMRPEDLKDLRRLVKDWRGRS